jgi:hypothetical protein
MAHHIKSFKKFKPRPRGPKGKDLSVFVRFGGLDLKNQKGYGKTTYHSPPAPRGIYAFPKVAQSLFLVGSLDKFQPGILSKKPEYPGKDASPEVMSKFEKERDAFDWDKSAKDDKKRYAEIRKEFTKTTGNIWHHLGEFCRHSDIVDTHGSWVKTSIADWQKAFSKSSLNDRYGEDFGFPKKATEKGRGEESINATRGISGLYAKDHYEVFFDEKV